MYPERASWYGKIQLSASEKKRADRRKLQRGIGKGRDTYEVLGFYTFRARRPHPEHPGFLAPAAQGLIDRIHKEVGSLAKSRRCNHSATLTNAIMAGTAPNGPRTAANAAPADQEELRPEITTSRLTDFPSGPPLAYDERKRERGDQEAKGLRAAKPPPAQTHDPLDALVSPLSWLREVSA